MCNVEESLLKEVEAGVCGPGQMRQGANLSPQATENLRTHLSSVKKSIYDKMPILSLNISLLFSEFLLTDTPNLDFTEKLFMSL